MFPDLIGEDQIILTGTVQFLVEDRAGADVMVGIAELFLGLEVEHLSPFAGDFGNVELLGNEFLDHAAACRPHDHAIETDHD